jgi:sulfoxide reductase heme-binding subunit YedZ
MTGPDPFEHGWWLLSRASGVTSYALASLAVISGLAISGKASDRPGGAKALRAVHEHAAIASLLFLVLHAVTLLPDPYLHPGIAGLLVPGVIGYRPLAVGAGLIAGYMTALLGLSFYARRRIGQARWRSLHRLTIVAWALSVAHTLTAGTDASTVWMRVVLATTCAPIVVLFAGRVLEGRRKARRLAQVRERTPRPAADAPARVAA